MKDIMENKLSAVAVVNHGHAKYVDRQGTAHSLRSLKLGVLPHQIVGTNQRGETLRIFVVGAHSITLD